MGLELVVSYNGIPVEVKRNLIPNHQPILYTHTRWAPISCKWGYNSYKYGYNFIYPFIRPFIGLITPFITGSGPPCRIHVTQLRGLSSFGPSLEPRCIRCPIAPFGAFGTCDSQGVSRVRVEIFRLGKRFHSLALVTQNGGVGGVNKHIWFFCCSIIVEIPGFLLDVSPFCLLWNFIIMFFEFLYGCFLKKWWVLNFSPPQIIH